MRPVIICHMLTSLDGALHPSRWTQSPDGERRQWSEAYEQIHEGLAGDAWIVGRVTMAEMAKAGMHAPVDAGDITRPVHVANRDAKRFAVALDPSGKVHFGRGEVGGDHVVVLLGRDAPDSHLAELASDGVSYIVSNDPGVDLAAAMGALGSEFGVRRLLLEGGAKINGSFFAAGLVDEVSILVAPALDGRPNTQSIVEDGDSGLAGRTRLSLMSVAQLDHGLVHLRYRAQSG